MRSAPAWVEDQVARVEWGAASLRWKRRCAPSWEPLVAAGAAESRFSIRSLVSSKVVASRLTQGASKKMTLNISFEEAIKGVEKEAAINNFASCGKCHGSGAASAASIKKCNRCQGSGMVHQSRGFFSMSSACPTCQGLERRSPILAKSAKVLGEQKHVSK